MNRSTTDANCTTLAKVLSGTFDLQLPAPTQFTGIPVMDNKKSFFAGPDEIWELFTLAMEAWMRPNVFMPLDGKSRAFFSSHYRIPAPSGNCTGDEYVKFLESLKKELGKQASEISFPELSHTAWTKKGIVTPADPVSPSVGGQNVVQSVTTGPEAQSTKFAKNTILCGTPGTGKTYSTVIYAVSIIEEKQLYA